MSPDASKVMYPELDEKQPRRAKSPMVAGSRRGTMLSMGEGDDVTGEVAPGGSEVGGGATEDVRVVLLLFPVGYGIAGTGMVEVRAVLAGVVSAGLAAE